MCVGCSALNAPVCAGGACTPQTLHAAAAMGAMAFAAGAGSLQAIVKDKIRQLRKLRAEKSGQK